jgi:hypothetical protein
MAKKKEESEIIIIDRGVTREKLAGSNIVCCLGAYIPLFWL